MASTFSPNLRLELIGTGEQQGTWGATTNTNLGTLLEEAIGGYVSVTVSDVGDTTLSTVDGGADQSRNMVINLTGAITADRDVICPAIEKLYVVNNNTSGGHDITFKVSGQTGVIIPNGETIFVYVDGTDANPITGTMAIQDSDSVVITGGTIDNVDITNGTINVANVVTSNVSITGGSISNVSLSSSNVSITGGSITGTSVSANSVSSSNVSITGGTITGITSFGSSNVSINGGTIDGITSLGASNVAITSGSFTGATNIESTNFNVGNASDTTITRVSAGVIAVEGNQVPSPGSVAQGDVLYYNGTNWARLAAGSSGQYLFTSGAGANPSWQYLKPIVYSTTNVASPWAWNSTGYDEFAITALANNLTINADAGSPYDGQKVVFRFKPSGANRTLTWTTGTAKSFRAIGVTIPTLILSGKTVYVGCIYNSADSRWDVVAATSEA